MKYGVRCFPIKYCRKKAREGRNHLAEIEQKIREYGMECNVDSSGENLKGLDEYELFFDYIVHNGKSEKNSKSFLNLGKQGTWTNSCPPTL